MDKRIHFSFRIKKDMLGKLRELSIRRNLPVSRVIEGILTEALRDDAPEKVLEALQRRVSLVDKKVSAVGFDVEILGELVSMFVLQYLCHTPPAPASTRGAVLMEGKRRHERFLQLLASRIQKGNLSLQTVHSTTLGDAKDAEPIDSIQI